MTGTLLFDPLLGWPLVWMAAGLAVLATAIALWRGLSGWWLRALAGITLILALLNPSLQQEERAPLSDIVLLIVDRSASQRIADRPGQIAEAVETLRNRIEARPNTDLRLVEVGDGDGDEGTLLMSAVTQAMAEEPRARIAGILAITDGRIHDVDLAPDLPAPFHTILTGREGDWDRRLVVRNAPAFAILGEPVNLTVRIEDQGDAPEAGIVDLTIAVDSDPPATFQVPVGEDIQLPVTLPHGGRNVLQFSTPAADGELTDRNNVAVVSINGVRDRLRVLLVSGEPHPGERTWRNLLKSDSSVDLVHFTILRPPDKQDGVPVGELSLIAFPTRELFMDKIDEFDLIIFDRYKRRGILPGLYLDNIRSYVEQGGAVLVAAGPDFASADSLYRSSLGDIIPGRPTARVIEDGFIPTLTDAGERHPVTEGLTEGYEAGEEGDPGWGRWFRLVDVETMSGTAVMEGMDGRPLLILDRVGQGRVALLASDHAWLWSRGYEGGGPQLELLRRLAHWMMKEPELEEEAFIAETDGLEVTIRRRTMADTVEETTWEGAEGDPAVIDMEEVEPGLFEGRFTAPEIGLYRITDGIEDIVVALGPSAPREFEQTIATGDVLAPVTEEMRGGTMRLEEGVPTIRDVRAGRPASGRGWIGLTPRSAYRTADLTVFSLVPPWLLLLVSALFVVGAWLREGRR
ncbi:hypothetical protein AADZ90_000450 [Aestuariibius sp. 2305UL40-4]|uniref:hypothetical protein n=1 Tax=Aestuariibius violaceus TaxID=3234132 RepID=UPI00345E5C74